MSKSNIYVLIVVAVIAAVFILQYMSPTESLGAPENRALGSSEVKEILLLEAIEQNITITDRELESAYLGLLNKSEMTQDEYDAYLIEQHGSREDFDAVVSENLKTLKLINDQVDWSRISIKDEDIDVFIAQNPEIFPPEQLNDPLFRETLYGMARQQMFESQRQDLINEYVAELVTKYKAN